MKNDNTKKLDQMRDEYDFSIGIRGKHVKAYRKGHKIIVKKKDGTEKIHYFKEKDGSVMLDPDIKLHFPNSESVNKALREYLSQH